MMHSMVTAQMGQSQGSEGSWTWCGLRSASNLDLHQAAEAVAQQDETKPTSPLPAGKKELLHLHLQDLGASPTDPPAV